MKKWLKTILSLVLALSMLPLSLAFAQKALFPAVGERVHGFIVKDVRTFDLLSADVTLFEHEKTGALVMYIANEDTNRTFDITFRTPAENDKGVSHVFEHSTLGGSEKYPSADLFFNLSYQTYNTYMNAMTYNNMTTYPVASLSEAQLLRYADYYADSCFHPVIYENEDIFASEAWRYAMTSTGSELKIAGTVYTEMQGSYTLQSAASYDFLKTLFPGSAAGYCFGGNPDNIPEMTNDDLIAYHQTYYHPSNSLSFLYGKFDDYAAFLELLDGYFSAYEKKAFDLKDKNYAPITAPVAKTFEYAVEKTAGTVNASTAYYGIVLGKVDHDTRNKLELLTTLLYSPASQLQQNLKAALPSAQAGCYIEITGPETAIVFFADGINKGEEIIFRDTVNASLKQIAGEGFDLDNVDAIIAATQLDVLLISESASIGPDMLPQIAYYWAGTGNVYGYLEFVDSIARFGDYAKDGTFNALISTYMLDNPRSALTITVPKAGLKEKKDAELKEKLANIKAGMTEEEIVAIVKNTLSQSQQKADDAAEYVRQLQAVTVDTLPEEARIYTVTDVTDESGVRFVHAQADADSVGNTLLLLNASGLKQEQLHYFKLYVDLLGELDTPSHDRGELASLITRYLYDPSIRVSVLRDDTPEGYTPYLRVSFTAMDDDMPAAYDLVHELLYESRIDDVQRLRDTVLSLINDVKQTMTGAVYELQLYRAYARVEDVYAYFNYVTKLDYYTFLEGLQAALESEPEKVVQALADIQRYFNNAAHAVVGFAGSSKSNENHTKAVQDFLGSLDKRDTDIVRQAYTFPEIGSSEAIVIDSAVQYNLRFADYEQLGMDGYSGALDAISAVVTDQFLYPLLRDQYGAYSVIHGASEQGVFLNSYRDPNIRETFEVYDQLPELIRGLKDLDQETLDGYILSSYAFYAQSQGELTGATNALLNTLEGIPQERLLDYMRELKSITAESVTAYADMYQKLVDNGFMSTAGATGKISANFGLYEYVLNPFGAKDPSQVVFADIAQDDRYFAAVRRVFEEGLMKPVADERFGPEENCSLGELISALYTIVGGNGNAEEGIEFLSQYGVLDPASTPDEQMTREELAVYVWCFCSALGIKTQELPMGLAPDAMQVSPECKGMFAWILKQGYMLKDADYSLQPKRMATRAEVALALKGILENMPK